MDSDSGQTLESTIPRRGRPRNPNIGSTPTKSKSGVSGVRKVKPRAVKLVLPSVQAAVQNVAKAAQNKTSEKVVKNILIAPKESTPITTFLFTPADGKTGTLTPVSKPGTVPMTLVQQVTTSGQTSIRQLPIAVSSNILPRVQVPTPSGSAPKLLLITTASNSAGSIPTTSSNQTLCKTILPVKLGNNSPNSGPVVAGNLGKQVLYTIPASQSSGMVLLSTTAPSQSGGAPKKFLLIPSSTTTKRQANTTVVLNPNISPSDPNSDKPVLAITTPTQTATVSNPNDPNKTPTTIVPITSLQGTTGKKSTRHSTVKVSSPSKPVNTSRRRGSVLGANSTISSIPSGIFKTVACTTNSRGICSIPVSVQTSQKLTNVTLTKVGGLTPAGPLISTPIQQTITSTQDASSNVTVPTVPQASLKPNCSTSSPHCKMSVGNIFESLTTLQPDTQASGSTPAKRPRPIPGMRAKKTVPKIDASGAATPSFITIPSSLSFSAIQLKPNSSGAALSTSGLPWVVSPNPEHQQKTNSNLENGTQAKDQGVCPKYKNMPKLIVVNGVSNGSFPATLSAQTSNNDGKISILSINKSPQCSQNQRPIYASPPKLTIEPGFSPSNKQCAKSGKKKRPSELMIIKEREEFIDDSMEKSNPDDLSPPKLQREDEEPGAFSFEMPPTEPSISPACFLVSKSHPHAQTKSNRGPLHLKTLFSTSALSTSNQYPSFLQDIKPMIRNDNFPTLASLSAKNSDLISRLDKNRKVSFGQLFNHFMCLANNKKPKKPVSHSAIMFKVAHSIHCCVVLTSMDIEGSVDLKDLPLSVEESMKCSVKCRRTFLKKNSANKASPPLLDPRFSLSILKSPDSSAEQTSRYHQSNSLASSALANEDSFSSSEFLDIKTKLPDLVEYHPDEPIPIPANQVCPKKSIAGLKSETSTQKSAMDSEASSMTPLTNCNCGTSIPCIEHPSSDCSKPTGLTTTKKRLFKSKKSCISPCCENPGIRGKKKGKVHACSDKSKKVHSPKSTSEKNTPCKIENEQNNTSDSSSVLNPSSHSSSSRGFPLVGKSYKITPRGHTGGGSDNIEKESNSTDNSDKTSNSPIETILPLSADPIKQNENETKTLTKTGLVGKRKRKQPRNDISQKVPAKKMNTGKTKDTTPSKSPSTPKKSPKVSSAKSPSFAKITLPTVERPPSSMLDPKHLYDEPSMADRVVMLAPDGKPILQDADLKITFDINSLPTPKKGATPSKKKSSAKSSETKSPSSIPKKSTASPKGKSPGTHSKISSRPPTLNSLLREMEKNNKSKSKSLAKQTPPETMDPEKSKKANIERVANNIASGYPAYGPGRPQCTMKLYKYFVSTRIKNRCKRDGSHEIDEPLILYINWKTLSRQPFSKHRITNHALNVSVIKKARQNSNYKKCKSRSKMVKPVKNKPLFMARRKALAALRKNKGKTKASNTSSKTKKKPSKLVQKSWQSKKKILSTKPQSIIKKKAKASIVSSVKPEKTLVKPEKTLVKPEKTLVKPEKTLVKPEKTLVKPEKTLVKPEKTLVKPEKTLVKPEKTLVKPEKTLVKPEKTLVKPERSLSSPELVPSVTGRRSPKTLVVRKGIGKRISKPTYKKQMDLLEKQKKLVLEKRASKKALKLSRSLSSPALRTTRSRTAPAEIATKSRVDQPKTPNADTVNIDVPHPEIPNPNLKKVDTLCETPSQIKAEPVSTEMEKSDAGTSKLNQPEILNRQANCDEAPPLNPVQNCKVEDSLSENESKVVNPVVEESPVTDMRGDIPNSSQIRENNEADNSPSEIMDDPVSTNPINIETETILEETQETQPEQETLIPSNEEQHSKVLNLPSNAPQLPISGEKHCNIETPISEEKHPNIETPISEEKHPNNETPISEEKHPNIETPISEEKHPNIETPISEEELPNIETPISEEKYPNIETPTPDLPISLPSIVEVENTELAVQPQLELPNLNDDSGNFIFEDYDDEEHSSPNADIATSSLNQNVQFDNSSSGPSADANPSVISNTNTIFTNITSSNRSSAFADKFDVGLSPELARIQRLKDQLREKQKALDLAKLYLK